MWVAFKAGNSIDAEADFSPQRIMGKVQSLLRKAQEVERTPKNVTIGVLGITTAAVATAFVYKKVVHRRLCDLKDATVLGAGLLYLSYRTDRDMDAKAPQELQHKTREQHRADVASFAAEVKARATSMAARDRYCDVQHSTSTSACQVGLLSYLRAHVSVVCSVNFHFITMRCESIHSGCPVTTRATVLGGQQSKLWRVSRAMPSSVSELSTMGLLL